MTKILHATVLGLGLVAGAVFSAQAQSVSALPPGAEAATQPQTARTMPFGSTQSFFPKPGGGQVITEQPSTFYAGNPAAQQNVTPGQPTPTGVPSQRPYSGGMGPKAN